MRRTHSLNQGWKYLPRFDEAFLRPDADLGDWEAVCLPHASAELPYNAFDEASCRLVSSYARDIDFGAEAEGRRVFLDFGAVMARCDAWLDGEPIGSHAGGYTPFSLELTGRAGAGRKRLVLRVDSREDPSIPPFGNVIDYLCYGGIYREVSLRIQEGAFIGDLWCRPAKVLEREKELAVEAAINAARPLAGASLLFRLERLSPQGRPAGLVAERDVGLGDIPPGAGASPIAVRFEGLRDIALWDTDSPELYRMTAVLRAGGGAIDEIHRDFGFRQAQWRAEGFFLNGRRLALRGLNRHQAFPYAGYAMPSRAQARDADILKFELGVNIVRTSHYPQSVHFLDRCDCIGLLVLEELPGWQHIGQEAWKDSACRALEEMILRDRSRPSVVLWGVRINESPDDHGFYARTNDIAHRLDPDRARGGIRNFPRSEVLEDVYTFNDFIHEGGKKALRLPRKVAGRRMPYLVTEHNGHMFPTKRFDGEERLREQALRHARVLSAAGSIPGIAGAIGWCAFDYNTHREFGSGDRICYHGVADMFRVPKFAAWAYASQVDPRRRVVLEAASFFSLGDRSALRILPVEVYTNCDSVVLFRDGERVGEFRPDAESFPGLLHPPVVIRDFAGERLDSLGLDARGARTVKRIFGRFASMGQWSLRLRDKLALGLVFLRNRVKRGDAEKLLWRLAYGSGAKEDAIELVGYLDGRQAIRKRYGSGAYAARLLMEADDAVLSSGDWDCTRIVLKLLDQYGNLCPFAAEAVDIEVDGPASVIGPRRLPLLGGSTAFWLRTEGRAGAIRVRALGGRFESNAVEIAVSQAAGSLDCPYPPA